MKDRFLGRWQLIPELSQYEFGNPPQNGTYVLESSGEMLEVRITWIDGEGQPGQASYGGAMDGSPIDLESPGGGQGPRFTLTRIDAATLDSAVIVGEDEVAWARRTASADGGLLSVVQTGSDPEAGPFRNFQVYRRLIEDSSSGE